MITSVITVIALGVIAVIGLALYLLPALVGWARRAPDLAALAVINVLLGWTLVGWVVALAMALRTASPPATVQVIQNLPPGVPPPGSQHGLPPGWDAPPGPLERPSSDAPPLALPPNPPDSSEEQE
jgi:hypothetical protein